jgi:hypothetical protein
VWSANFRVRSALSGSKHDESPFSCWQLGAKGLTTGWIFRGVKTSQARRNQNWPTPPQAPLTSVPGTTAAAWQVDQRNTETAAYLAKCPISRGARGLTHSVNDRWPLIKISASIIPDTDAAGETPKACTALWRLFTGRFLLATGGLTELRHPGPGGVSARRDRFGAVTGPASSRLVRADTESGAD